MTTFTTTERIPSPAELRSDAVVHVLGMGLAVVAVPVLLVLTAMWRGDAAALIGVSIYGATLIAMIVCSALYNMATEPRRKAILRRFDHSAIYFKIAGTYTPLSLLSGGQGPALLITLWVAAVAGSCLRVLAPNRLRWVAFGLYLAMGWAGLVLGRPLLAVLSTEVLTLVVTGGCIYSVGTLFYLSKMRFQKAVWHVFVLVATMVFYAAVLVHVRQTAG